jgi:hypothetical protein
MWADRLRGEPRFEEALERLWPAALAVLDAKSRPLLAERLQRDVPSNGLLLGVERGEHDPALAELWEEMTMVRRSVPGATW